QPIGGARGQATHIEIQEKEILRMKEMLSQIMANCTGKSLSEILNDTERDNYMSAEEAKNYGLIDQVFKK
ncbi:ATP-dependent Clp protease proteolytic subunit, partial [Fusobacterium ulcerans]